MEYLVRGFVSVPVSRPDPLGILIFGLSVNFARFFLLEKDALCFEVTRLAIKLLLPLPPPPPSSPVSRDLLRADGYNRIDNAYLSILIELLDESYTFLAVSEIRGD